MMRPRHMADQPPLADGLKAARGTFRFKSDLRNHQAIVQPRKSDLLDGI